jgi:hypothetical protein
VFAPHQDATTRHLTLRGSTPTATIADRITTRAFLVDTWMGQTMPMLNYATESIGGFDPSV